MHGYAHEGQAFFNRMNGMFAFALVDGQKDIVHIVRDRLIKNQSIYVKEITKSHSLLRLNPLFSGFDTNEWIIDRQALSEYLCYQTPMSGRTLFEDISLVKPGHHMVIDVKTLSIIQNHPYWKRKRDKDIEAFPEALGQKIKHCLEEKCAASPPL